MIALHALSCGDYNVCVLIDYSTFIILLWTTKQQAPERRRVIDFTSFGTWNVRDTELATEPMQPFPSSHNAY
jgi:hypothetical protein